MDVGEKIVEVEDGITDQLAGAMVGDIAAPVDAVVGRTELLKKVPIRQQVRFVAAFAEGIHVRMFAKQQVVWRRLRAVRRHIPVGNFARHRIGKQALLQVPCNLVINQTEVLNLNGFIL